MKKLITLLLVVFMVFSLCACGSVDIGPLTFHFGGSTTGGSASADSGWSGGAIVEAPAVEAPAAEAPAEEIPPMEVGEYDIDFGDFTVDFHGGIIGEFSGRGIPANLSNEGYSPYLIVTFTYTDTTGTGNGVFIDGVLVGDVYYPMVDPYYNSDHFVNNIDRYFGYEYTYEYAELDGSSQVRAFACFALDEMGMVMLDAGEPCYIGFNGNLIESNFSYHHAEMIDEILVYDEELGYTYESSHAGATFLWAVDFSYYLLQQIEMNVEEAGDSGYMEDTRALDYLSMLFFKGASMSPAVTPNFYGDFQTDFGPMPFYIEMASEMYPDAVDCALEYADFCMMISDIARSPGNYDEVMEYIHYAYELHSMLADVIMASTGIDLHR